MANAYNGILGSRRMGGKKNLHLIQNTSDAWEIVKERARELGLTQKELASMAGLSELALTMWNRPKRSPNLDGITRLCNALGIQLEIGLRVHAVPDELKSFIAIKKKEREAKKARQALEKQLKKQQRDRHKVDK